MKNIVKIGLILTTLVIGFQSYAQKTIKLGHINSQELISSMPETDSAQNKLQSLAQQYEATSEQLQVELNQKYEVYLQNQETYTDLIKSTKEAEITDLQERIQNFNTTAQQDLQRQQQELFLPIQEKAKRFITEVAEENGFTYIFDMSVGAVVFAAEDTEDITPLVKQKMGIE